MSDYKATCEESLQSIDHSLDEIDTSLKVVTKQIEELLDILRKPQIVNHYHHQNYP